MYVDILEIQKKKKKGRDPSSIDLPGFLQGPRGTTTVQPL